MNDFAAKAAECRQYIETVLFVPKMSLIYDYRSSLEPGKYFDHLPTPEEIAQRLPNPCGWAAGMEDSVINGGVALDMYIDLGDAEWAAKIFAGLKRCATVAGVPGFVARSVSPIDGKSFFPESSRDQYTHFIYGLWRYFHSTIASAEAKAECARLLVEVARFFETYVTEENNWTLPRGDFGEPRSSVCKMAHVNAHEAARLPMAYAAAWDVTGDDHWRQCCLQWRDDALAQSLGLGDHSYHSYALLQMLCSIRLLHDVEPDAAAREKCLAVMRLIDEYSRFNLLRAVDESYATDFSALPGNWRDVHHGTSIPGCGHFIPDKTEAYRLSYHPIRECGESLLNTLLLPESLRNVTDLQRRLFRFVIGKLDLTRHTTYAPLYPAAAFYKAKALGIEI